MPTLCLQGGNELTPPCIPMDTDLLHRVPGGPLVVVPLASRPGTDYQRTGEHAARYFRALGVDVEVAPDARRAPDDAAATVRTAAAVVLTGGSPRTLRDALADSGLGRVIVDRFRAGCLVMGSSAGAMVACETTLLPQWRGSPQVGPGLGLLAGFVVVPHYDGKRTAWVRAALSAGDVTVLGVPECSGVIVELDGDRVSLEAVGVAPTTVVTHEGQSLLVAGDGFEPS